MKAESINRVNRSQTYVPLQTYAIHSFRTLSRTILHLLISLFALKNLKEISHLRLRNPTFICQYLKFVFSFFYLTFF